MRQPWSQIVSPPLPPLAPSPAEPWVSADVDLEIPAQKLETFSDIHAGTIGDLVSPSHKKMIVNEG
jgi:hypothetical protein